MTALLEQVPVIVRSRLRPPDPHPDELLRPRLLSLLNAYTEPVILLAAPGGSGKTVLLAQWIRSTARRCAWVQLGPLRAGLCDVWSAILQALDPFCDSERSIALDGRTDAHILLNRVIPELLNRLTGSDPLVLVLDGLDAVDDPRARESLTYFVLQLPAHVQTVLSTNRPAGGPVALLRANGRLAELTAEELRFTGPEAHDLLAAVARRPVAEDDAMRVCRGVDGWGAGLRLAGLAFRRGRSAGVPREVIDYVCVEVLDKAAPQQRAALVQTSILRELRTSWVNSIIGTWATRALASFARSSLFLQPTADGWVCHAALKAAAVEHLLRSEPELRPALHDRASQLLCADGDLLGAAEHALEAGKSQRACDLLCAAWPAGDPGELVEYVSRLGGVMNGPAACTGAAAALTQGDAARAMRLLGGVGNDGHALQALALLQLGKLSKARTCLTTSPAISQPETWLAVVSQMVDGLITLWDGCPDNASALLRTTATAAANIGYVDALVRTLDGIVACAVLSEHHDTARDAALRAVSAHSREPQRATSPVISLAYLEVSGHEMGAVSGALQAPHDGGGPHQAAFAESLRATAAHTAGDWVAYRLAQSRGRSSLEMDEAGTLLRTLLADRVCAKTESVVDSTRRLTSRELAVLKALSGPLTLPEIAREFHVSHNTVKTQVSSLFRKLEVHNRAGAVDAARERGLIRA